MKATRPMCIVFRLCPLSCRRLHFMCVPEDSRSQALDNQITKLQNADCRFTSQRGRIFSLLRDSNGDKTHRNFAVLGMEKNCAHLISRTNGASSRLWLCHVRCTTRPFADTNPHSTLPERTPTISHGQSWLPTSIRRGSSPSRLVKRNVLCCKLT